MSEENISLVDRLRGYIPNGDGYNDPICLDLARAADTIEQLERDIAFLQSCVNSGETAKPSDRPSQRAKHGASGHNPSTLTN